MRTITVSGKRIEVDEEGFLVNRSDWNEEVAKEMARADGLELTPAHWEVIHFMREYYEEYQFTPPVRMLINRLVAKSDFKFRKDYLNKRETYLNAGKNRYLRRLRLLLWAEFPTYEQYLCDGRRQIVKHLYTLFPGGPAKQAHRYAGLPRPCGVP